jgi:hypothetical protein
MHNVENPEIFSVRFRWRHTVTASDEVLAPKFEGKTIAPEKRDIILLLLRANIKNLSWVDSRINLELFNEIWLNPIMSV